MSRWALILAAACQLLEGVRCATTTTELTQLRRDVTGAFVTWGYYLGDDYTFSAATAEYVSPATISTLSGKYIDACVKGSSACRFATGCSGRSVLETDVLGTKSYFQDCGSGIIANQYCHTAYVFKNYESSSPKYTMYSCGLMAATETFYQTVPTNAKGELSTKAQTGTRPSTLASMTEPTDALPTKESSSTSPSDTSSSSSTSSFGGSKSSDTDGSAASNSTPAPSNTSPAGNSGSTGMSGTTKLGLGLGLGLGIPLLVVSIWVLWYLRKNRTQGGMGQSFRGPQFKGAGGAYPYTPELETTERPLEMDSSRRTPGMWNPHGRPSELAG